MRSLKKRILSFVSAVAMVATVVPTTGLFASAAEVGDETVIRSGEFAQWEASDKEENGTFSVDTSGTYTISADYWWNGQDNTWLKLEIDGTTIYNAKDTQANANVPVSKDIHLDNNGNHTYHMLVKNSAWKNVKATLKEADAPAKDPVDLSTLGVTISAMSNDKTKGTVSPTGILENPNSTTLTCTTVGENNFVGWYVRASNDNTVGQLLKKSGNLDVNAVSGYIADYAKEHAGKSLTIFATFAGWKNYRYEAEDYVKLISETQYQKAGGKYDDPTVVLEGNTGYKQGSASNTTYDSNGKFADGHYAKEAGSGSSEYVTISTLFNEKATLNNGDDVAFERTFNLPNMSDYSAVRIYVKGWFQGDQGEWAKISVNDDAIFDKYNQYSNYDLMVYKTISTSDTSVKVQGWGKSQWSNISLIELQGIKKTESTGGDRVKYQHYYGSGGTYDAMSYSDLKIAPKYSNGQAVALTGPSNGLAVPFSLTEATTTDMKVEMGYNFGTLPTNYLSTEGGQGEYDYTGSLWVNIYYLGNNGNMSGYNTFKNVIKNGTQWKDSGNAYYDKASGALKAMMPSVNNLHDYTSAYAELSIEGQGSATYIDGTEIPGSGNNRSSDKRVTLNLPKGLPEGSYAITVATDQGNCDDANESIGGYYKSGDSSIDWHAGTAYYDYIQFRMIDDPTKPNVFVSGADISFTDSGIGNDGEDSKMKNTLRVTEFSDISFDENGLKFTPVAPEFLVNQGYEFTGWTLKVNNDPGKGTSNELTLDKILGSADKTNYSETCAAISSYAFPAGTSIEFIANYKIENGSQTLTVEGGTIYIPEGGRKNNHDGTEDTENYTIAAKDKKVTLRRFANVKLVADKREGETFSYWTVNGMIYSYNPEIFFSSVYDATFVANYDENGTKPEATAYLDQTVAISGFSAADNTNQQKLTFLAEYSINDGSYDVKKKFGSAEFGLIYAATDKGLDNMKSAKNSTSWNGAPAKCGKMVVTNQNNIIRNETFFGIGGLKKDKTYYAMSYVVYNGKVYYSDIISITPTADNNGTPQGTIVK